MDDDSWQTFIKGVKPLPQDKRIPLYVPMRGYHQDRSDGDFSPLSQSLAHSFSSPFSSPLTHQLAHPLMARPPSQRLDLHGVRQHQVDDILTHFFTQAQYHNYKHVLIITGKGTPPLGGVIRQLTEQWFKTHAHFVVSYQSAKPKNGGTGAFSVHVRKKRS